MTTLSSTPPLTDATPPTFEGWRADGILSVDDLSDADIAYLFALCDFYAPFVAAGAPPPRRLEGKTQVNLFYENSTRTNLSFEIAGKKLGADVLNVPVAASSVNKGEALVDTAQTLDAMGAAVMVIRHGERGAQARLADRLGARIVNGGDGAAEHPTQALLDAATLRTAFGRIEGLTIAICGDVRHSRVAGSNARLLARLGAQLRFVGPPPLMPADGDFADAPRFDRLDDGLAGVDVAMALRIQSERMDGTDAQAAAAGYFDAYGLTHARLDAVAPNAKVMHPGPMNRGVEIDGALADDPARSLILAQVFHGVPMRMAVLDAVVNRGA
ncbi:MAG: aspartate carbamoyltransferase catalytic subunit [Pseudomonadota bacterium]